PKPETEPPPPAPEPGPQPAAEPTDDPRALIEELFERARRGTHYEVLGVARSAKPDELKRVYYALARRLHPDRFRRDTDEPIRQQIDAAFAKVTQAYEVLKDSRLRASYDMKLPPPGGEARRVAPGEGVKAERGGGGSEAPASPALSKESAQLARAEEAFQQGLAALQKNHLSLARRSLGEAALLGPRQARYRAYYGRALARDKNSRRQAEAELQAAISLDEKNPSYRVMLAELYQEHGLRTRAEGELERALQLDPKHAAARRLLEQLRAGR
ncbi:MAG TPA: DnaJ domain-containing protein, partial [Pyrinomonadaceae bacterium]|nr:DnaJ domain-containing protein [Pyrinomonadaceae bacterium]